jgi:hypothetical protein
MTDQDPPTRDDPDARESAREDLRSTSDSIRQRAKRLIEIETRKRELPPDDPRVDELSDQAVEESGRLARETRAERQLSDELG